MDQSLLSMRFTLGTPAYVESLDTHVAGEGGDKMSPLKPKSNNPPRAPSSSCPLPPCPFLASRCFANSEMSSEMSEMSWCTTSFLETSCSGRKSLG